MGQRSDVRNEKTEDGRQRTEDGCRRVGWVDRSETSPSCTLSEREANALANPSVGNT